MYQFCAGELVCAKSNRSSPLADAWVNLHRGRAVHDNLVLCDGDHTGTDSALAPVGRAGLLVDQRGSARLRHGSFAFKFRQSSRPGSTAQAHGSERTGGGIGKSVLCFGRPQPPWLLAARFVTGVALAGVYPPALKLMSTWFVRGRGIALGFVIAALTLGSALPHLVRFLTNRVALASCGRGSLRLHAVWRRLSGIFCGGGPVSVQQGGVQSTIHGCCAEEPAARPRQSRLFRPYVGTLCHVGMVPGLCVCRISSSRFG